MYIIASGKLFSNLAYVTNRRKPPMARIPDEQVQRLIEEAGIELKRMGKDLAGSWASRVSKTLFDAAWIVATLSIPASTIADVTTRLLAAPFGDGQKNVLVDLVILVLFGSVQYSLMGYTLGWTIDRFRK